MESDTGECMKMTQSHRHSGVWVLAHLERPIGVWTQSLGYSIGSACAVVLGLEYVQYREESHYEGKKVNQCTLVCYQVFLQVCVASCAVPGFLECDMVGDVTVPFHPGPMG